MDEVDFTVLAATSVFTDLMEKCPPAEACRDAFDRTVKATVKMANSTGGFGPKPRAAPDLRQHRLDWASSRATTTADSASQISSSSKHRRPNRLSIEQLASTTTDLSSISDAYSNSVSPSSQMPPFPKQQQQYRLKNEPSEGGSGFSLMHNLSAPPRSNASGSSADKQAVTPEAVDPSLMGSPLAAHMNSPVVGMAPPAFSQVDGATLFSPDSGMGFADLQGMDFLQALDNSATGVDGNPEYNFGEQMDLGFGLGWEGLHHDFSEGQQVDLFDGFFFGGQQGSGGAGLGGNSVGMGGM